jgi:hypothetical protein
MSRSFNERSIPNQQGRRQEMKTKRHGHKIARRMPLESSRVELKLAYIKLELDRETKQKGLKYG